MLAKISFAGQHWLRVLSSRPGTTQHKHDDNNAVESQKSHKHHSAVLKYFVVFLCFVQVHFYFASYCRLHGSLLNSPNNDGWCCNRWRSDGGCFIHWGEFVNAWMVECQHFFLSVQTRRSSLCTYIRGDGAYARNIWTTNHVLIFLLVGLVWYGVRDRILVPVLTFRAWFHTTAN